MGHKFKCEFSIAEMIGQLIIWLLLTIITFGLALFFLPYYLLKLPINRTYLLDQKGAKVARLHVDVSFGDILGHAVIWFLLTIVTLGLAYLLYWQAVVRRLLNAVSVTEL